MGKDDRELGRHRQWLGYLQPVGLVVSPVALVRAQAYPNQNVVPLHRRFLEQVVERPDADGADKVKVLEDLAGLLTQVLGWRGTDLCGHEGGDPLPDTLEVVLTEYQETLRPTYAVREPAPEADGTPWLLLLEVLPTGTALDDPVTGDGRHWQASPQARFERLLRETGVPSGLLFNGTHLRLVHAPRGETSGYLTFPVAAMAEVPGRPILAALEMLLGDDRLFTLPREQRLPAILADSRRYQNKVSTDLADQVLHALYELQRGLQAAHDRSGGTLLADVLREEPNEVYAGLLTVMLRLVFVLYAEERELLPSDAVYTNHYSVVGLFEKLRSDAARHPDTMDQRYGAWPRLLALFRLIHDGASHGDLRLPARHGDLFDPDRYSFLEGRPHRLNRVKGAREEPPLIADGVVFRVLEKLLVLKGERLSYRSLDVEQIGSVYETMMGFDLEVAHGRSIAVKSPKRHGAAATIDLEELLEEKPGDRAKWIKKRTDREITGKTLAAIKEARTPEALVAALDKNVAKEATPRIVPPEAMVLQPSDARRRSGSHYTPRSLTEPIVRKALEPVLRGLGERPSPDRILALSVCDPAMGSGAFLVEAARQLAEALVAAWHAHDAVPTIPPDEDELLHARRLVTQRCIYGVDRNPLAVHLAKMSLWLATLARDHAFTFLDHALCEGDALVGLTRDQLTAFHWNPKAQDEFVSPFVDARIEEVSRRRRAIQEAGDEADPGELRRLERDADAALEDVRLIGDCVVASFFMEKKKDREGRRQRSAEQVRAWLGGEGPKRDLEAVRSHLEDVRPSVVPFHWHVEFPEVFAGDGLGFDAIVGNPPFAGKNTIIAGNREGYLDWLKGIHEEAHGNSDLVAHFYRRAFDLLRDKGTFGLIATNTIGQGDTRTTGLRWICNHGGTVYAARKRLKWPGAAAVVVSVVHVRKGSMDGPFDLDGRQVPIITAYLFHDGGHDDPKALLANAGKSFQGSIVLGMGFTFDDTDKDGIASPIAEMERLIAQDARNQEVVFPYIGYAEVATHPEHAPHRYVIHFGEREEEECRRRWPDLMEIVEKRVRPERAKLTKNAIGRKRAKYWWQYGSAAKALYSTIAGMSRVIVAGSQATKHFAFAFLPTGLIYSSNLTVIAWETYGRFSQLQCRVHEIWSRFFMTTLKDDLVYTPTTCFASYPFLEDPESLKRLEAVGNKYYEYRAHIMATNEEGLTKTYNRFHDPEERSPGILELRRLHETMDREVLDAYGWTDIRPVCEFLLDYEDDEENGSSRRKKPWRLRWPDEIHDEVLARLLKLNRARDREETKWGAVGAETARRGKGG